MIIHRLSISGFGIIGERVEISFQEDGKIGIIGQNESGKSTLFKAIEYALYGLKRGPSEHETRENIVTWGKNEARIDIEFTSGESRFYLERVIGAKSGHRARLIQFVGGVPDASTAITNLREIEEKIEQITGMDRDSFTKLVYFKQKDLDALRELAKARREQLINKVMGIEVFDEAQEGANTELKRLDSELSLKNVEREQVEKEAKEYEEQTTAKNTSLEELGRLDSEKVKRGDLLREKERLVQRYEWLQSKTSKDALYKEVQSSIQSLKKRLEEMEGLQAEEQGLKDRLKEHEKTDEIYEALKEIREVKNEMDEVDSAKEEKLTRKAEVSTNISRQQGALDKYEQPYQELSNYLGKYNEVESKLSLHRQELQKTEEQKASELQKYGVSEEDMARLSEELPKKSRFLLHGVLLAFIGVAAVIAGLTVNLLMMAVGLASLILSVIPIRRYLRLEELSSLGASIKSLSQIIQQKRGSVSELLKEMERLKEESGFGSSDEIELKIQEITEGIKSETGIENIDALRALLQQNMGELEKIGGDLKQFDETLAGLYACIDELSKVVEAPENLDEKIKEYEERSREKHTLEDRLKRVESDNERIRKEDPESNLKILKERSGQIEAEIGQLEKNKPELVDTLAYSKEEHDRAKEEYESARTALEEVKGQIIQLNQKLEDIETRLDKTRPSYERYPVLQTQISDLEHNVQLHKMLITEFKETSRELRSKVIPHATFVINQILPSLTDGRYSDFEITEDLTFKVHSMDAGGYKERELFSGGTQDQFLIALRLAFTQSILDSRVMADHYSLLMDECISSSDDVRKQGIFEVLEAMKKTFSQIFIIAHEDISNYVDNHITLARNEHGYTEIRSRSW